MSCFLAARPVSCCTPSSSIQASSLPPPSSKAATLWKVAVPSRRGGWGGVSVDLVSIYERERQERKESSRGWRWRWGGRKGGESEHRGWGRLSRPRAEKEGTLAGRDDPERDEDGGEEGEYAGIRGQASRTRATDRQTTPMSCAASPSPPMHDARDARIRPQRAVLLEHPARLTEEDARLLRLGDDVVRFGGEAGLSMWWSISYTNYEGGWGKTRTHLDEHRALREHHRETRAEEGDAGAGPEEGTPADVHGGDELEGDGGGDLRASESITPLARLVLECGGGGEALDTAHDDAYEGPRKGGRERQGDRERRKRNQNAEAEHTNTMRPRPAVASDGMEARAADTNRGARRI
ncbi:hypothetical protein K438DRAFT_1771465 [Mycena galopus ATCC 62051]|nr:hypothetical protein K438DRAFT_1771465 [Mycena galopus ATCC 62051]